VRSPQSLQSALVVSLQLGAQRIERLGLRLGSGSLQGRLELSQGASLVLRSHRLEQQLQLLQSRSLVLRGGRLQDGALL